MDRKVGSSYRLHSSQVAGVTIKTRRRRDLRGRGAHRRGFRHRGSTAHALAQVPDGAEKLVSVEYPSGETSVMMNAVMENGVLEVSRAAVLRTARKLFEGRGVPRSVPWRTAARDMPAPDGLRRHAGRVPAWWVTCRFGMLYGV